MRHICRPISILLLFATALSLSAASITKRYDFSSGLSSSRVGGGVLDRDGLLWFATWNGLNCYDGYEFHWLKIQPGDKASIGTDLIRDILLSPEGNILCHTDNDIYEFCLDTYSFNDIPDERKDSLQGMMGMNWPGVTDRQGNLWTADRQGLYKTYTPHHPATTLKVTEGEHPRAFLLTRDGRLMVGTRANRGIKIYDRGRNLVETIPLRTTPYCMFQTRDGGIWIGGKPGALMRLGEESISSDAVYDLKEDSRGRLWVATFGDGVKCVPEPADENPRLSASFGGKKIRQLLITPSDNIIAATTDGLLIGHIDPGDYRSTELRPVRRDGDNPGSLCNNATMSLARDSDGNIYIATESSGIDIISERDLFSGNPVFTHVNRQNSSLTSDICKAMTLAADSLLMIVGGDNVMAFNPRNGNTVNFSKNFWSDTCQFAETTPLRLPDGTWLFGAEQGAFLASRESMLSRGYIPPLVFTTLAINGEPEKFCLVPKTELSLLPGQRNITIHFAAVDYIDNTEILYRTRVDGSPWTNADHARGVTLFNLSPGTHILEAQSTDRYGRWVDNNRELSIVVAPYWHETWWAKTLAAILALSIFGGALYTYLYIRRVNRQRRDLLEKYMALIHSGETKASPAVNIEKTDASETRVGTGMPDVGERPEETPFLNRVRRYIEENIGNPDANINEMAAAAAASRSTLNRHLRSQLGVSAAQLLTEARMQRAEQMLRDTACPVADIAMSCGYSDTQYFQRVFKAKRGISPADYRANRLENKSRARGVVTGKP